MSTHVHLQSCTSIEIKGSLDVRYGCKYKFPHLLGLSAVSY